MDPWTEILTGVEGGWRLLFSVPPVPMVGNRDRQNMQLAIGLVSVLALCGWMLFGGS